MLLLLHDYLVVGAIAVQYRKCNAQVLIQVDNYSYYFLTTTTTGETNSRSTIVMCGAVAGANCWPVIVFIYFCLFHMSQFIQNSFACSEYQQGHGASIGEE
jgi:hypothetical protein